MELLPTVVDNTNYHDIGHTVRTLNQIEGYTPMGCGIRLAADILAGIYDEGFELNPENRQVFTLVTDGEPNCEWIPGTYTGNYENYNIGKTSAEEARNYLINTVEITENQDEFDVLAVGDEPDVNWLNRSIVWPQPGYIAPPFNHGPGWVSTINTWQDFENAVDEMFTIIFNDITGHVMIVNMEPSDPYLANNDLEVIITPE